MSWLAGAAVTLAVLAARGPRERPVADVARRPAPARTPGVTGTAQRTGRRGLAWRGAWPGRHGARPDRDLALVVTDVAARLRGGVGPRAAWEAALGHPVGPEGPGLADLGGRGEDRARAAGVVAAGRLAAELGAPLAPLLDGVAGQLAAQGEADGERRAALAGPRTTARVLTCLPAVGVGLGVAVGADLVAVLLDGSVGTAALVAGLVLVLAGSGWTAALTRQAAAAGRDA